MQKKRVPVCAAQVRAQGSLELDLSDTTRIVAVNRYLHLTRAVMPALASTERRDWPVQRDHCFQRIVLDTICGGVWHDHIARPAYAHLSLKQAELAVQLCEQIIARTISLHGLNKQSLVWRGKQRQA